MNTFEHRLSNMPRDAPGITRIIHSDYHCICCAGNVRRSEAGEAIP